MAIYDRLLKGVNNGKDENAKNVLKLLESREPNRLFTSDSPIPNQAFSSAKNRKGGKVTLFLKPNAVEGYRQILRLQSKQKKAAISSGNTTLRPIEYLCLGYQESGGDIIIEDIVIPAINYHMEANNNSSQENAIASMFSTKSNSKEAKNERAEITGQAFDYLRTPLSDEEIELNKTTAKVCLFGTTANGLVQNSFSLGNVAKSVAPGNIDFPQNILTGNIAHFTTKANTGLCISDIECLIIPHLRNSKTGKTTPTSIQNIAEIIMASPNDHFSKINTATAEQPYCSHRIFEKE